MPTTQLCQTLVTREKNEHESIVFPHCNVWRLVVQLHVLLGIGDRVDHYLQQFSLTLFIVFVSGSRSSSLIFSPSAFFFSFSVSFASSPPVVQELQGHALLFDGVIAFKLKCHRRS